MKALQVQANKGLLSLEDLPRPEVIAEDDVIIEVGFAGLCGTDLHIVSGEFSVVSDKKVTISHEFSGTIIQLGPQAEKRFKVGDKVGVDPNRPCHQCQFCVRGQVHFCQEGGCRDATGIFRDGGLAQYCRVPAEQVFVLPSSVSLKTGALCEPLSCLVHGWQRLMQKSPIQPDHRVLVTGAGIIGNLWVVLLHHHGFRNVTVSEPAEGRRKITEGLDTGFHVLTPTEVAAAEEGKDPEQFGFDVIIECSGFPPALQQALSWTKRGATIIIFGCAPPGKAVSICPEDIFRKELTILGSLINPHTYSRAVQLAATLGPRYLDYDRLGVAVFALEKYEEAIHQLRTGAIAKAVFDLSL